MKKEDILNTCYSNWTWIRTGCRDKLDDVLDCATVIIILVNKKDYALDFYPKVM